MLHFIKLRKMQDINSNRIQINHILSILLKVISAVAIAYASYKIPSALAQKTFYYKNKGGRI